MKRGGGGKEKKEESFNLTNVPSSPTTAAAVAAAFSRQKQTGEAASERASERQELTAAMRQVDSRLTELELMMSPEKYTVNNKVPGRRVHTDRLTL